MTAGASASRRLTLAATALGSGVAFLDTTVVVVALPRMEEDLRLGLAGQQWVYLAYALTLASLYLVGGALGDRFGLRRAFVAGTVVFAAASLVCAVAPGEATIVAGRALQGVGGAVLTTTSLALLRVVWADQAGRAIGLWTSLTSVATVAGPPLGGAVVQWASWRLVFVVNVPLAVVVVALALAGRGEEEREPGRASLDLVGSALAAVGLAGITFALVERADRGTVAVLPAGLVGLAALAGLLVWTVRARDPLVPRSLLRRPGLAVANGATLVIYAALGAQLLFVPLSLQFFGLTPFEAGFAFTPPSVALVLLAPRVGRLADRDGPRRYVTGGALLVALAALLLLPLPDAGGVRVWVPLSLGVFSLGVALIVAPITAAAIAPAPPALAGVASGLNQTVARAGGLVSVALLGAVVAGVYTSSGGPPGETPLAPGLDGVGREASIDAYRAGMLVIGAFAAAGAGIALRLRAFPSAGARPDGGTMRPTPDVT